MEDGLEEPDETIVIALTGVTGGRQLGNPSIHTHTILAPPPQFEVGRRLRRGRRLHLAGDVSGLPPAIPPGPCEAAVVGGLTNVVTLTNDLRRVVVKRAQPGFYRAGHLVNSLEMEFVWIEPGTFTMGVGNDLKLPDSVADFDEQPQHAVALTQGYLPPQRQGVPVALRRCGFAGVAGRCELAKCRRLLRLAQPAGGSSLSSAHRGGMALCPGESTGRHKPAGNGSTTGITSIGTTASPTRWGRPPVC